MPTVDQWCQSL